MDYNAFKQEWLGRRIDFDHSGTYLASDLIREYAFNMYKLGFDLYDIAAFWYEQPEGMSDYYFQSNDMTVKQGDFVIINDFKHVVIANGEQTPEKFEALEQNVTGSGKGDGDDAVRENWYDKALIKGIYRARFAPDRVIDTIEPVSEPVVEVEPEVTAVTPEPIAKPYKHPTGALRVPLNRVEFRIIADLWAYAFMSHAQTGEKPVEKLKAGKYFMLSQHGGMAKIDRGEGTQTYWINPADNVVKRFNDAFKDDPRTGYKWYGGNNAEESRPIKYKADGDDVKRNRKTEVFSFNPAKENASIAYNQPVWIAGTCVVRSADGDKLYGVPANPNSNGTFSVMKSYAIPMSQLTLAQMDYDPEEDNLIQDVEPAEAEAFLPPRKVSFQDRNYALKGRTQRLVDNFIKMKKEK